LSTKDLLDEDELLDGDEVLFRQVHPKFIVEGRPTRQIFTPMRKDAGLLSVDRSSKCSAAQSCAAHIDQGFQTSGALGVTVTEVASASLRAFDDEMPPAKPAHAIVDMSLLSRRETETAAAVLRDHALTRDWLHGPLVGPTAGGIAAAAPV
jgi:hypothetical protein